MNSDSSLDLVCTWNRAYEEEDFAFAVGTMLKMMTNGEYDEMIIEALKSEGNISKSSDFITQVLAVWQLDNALQDKANEDRPVMSPLQTFGESNFGMSQ